MEIIDVEQLSEEWFKARCGIPTSSRFNKILTSTGKSSSQIEKYAYQLAGERIIEDKEDLYTNRVMQRGIEKEQEARELYELNSGYDVKVPGFCVTEGKYKYGASPDGIIELEDDKLGLLEIKCPKLATQVKYLVKRELPTKYIQQVQGQMLVTGAEWLDFVSYYPAMELMKIRVAPDYEYQAKLKEELEKTCELIDKTVEKLRKKS